MAEGLGGPQAVQGDRGARPAQVLLPRDVSVPVRPHSHGPRAGLRDRRSAGPLQVDAGLQRAAPDGLGRLRAARRERGHRERGASGGVDLREHRQHAHAVEAHGHLLRLGPRGGHLRSRLLQVGAARLRPDARARPRLPAAVARELVPVLPDRARQRAGRGGPLLALRFGGDDPRDRRLVLQDHRLRPGAARLVRPAARLAGAGAHHAAQLDRPQRGRRVRAAGGGPAGSQDPDLHHAPRHLLRHDLRGARPRAPAGGPPRRRRGGAPSGRRLPRRGRARDRDRAARHRPAQARPPAQGPRGEPIQLSGDPALPRRLRADGLRHRGDHGGAGRGPARLGLREGKPTADHRHREATGGLAGGSGLPRRRREDQLRIPRRAHHRGGQAQGDRLAGGPGARAGQDQLPPPRLGDQPAALLGGPDPGALLRAGRHGAGARGEPAGGAAA